MRQKNLFSSFACGASYSDIKEQVHAKMPERPRKVVNWRIPAFAVATLALIAVMIPFGKSLTHSANKAATNDQAEAPAQQSERAEATGQVGSIFAPESVLLANKQYAPTSSYSVANKLNNENLNEVRGERLMSYVNHHWESQFKQKHPELPYEVLVGEYDWNVYTFYRWSDYEDLSYVICIMEKLDSNYFYVLPYRMAD